MYSWNTSPFSNKAGKADQIYKWKALVAKIVTQFNGEPKFVVQFLVSIAHRCAQCGITSDINFIFCENAAPSTFDLIDFVQKFAWDINPARFQYENLLVYTSKATMENIKFMHTLVRNIVARCRSQPIDGSVEAALLTSFQNRM
jgi:hypothetical protein